MEKIINKAIEGGYNEYAFCNEFDIGEGTTNFCHYKVVTDPLFWQALGKSCGWTTLHYYRVCTNVECECSSSEERWMSYSFCPRCATELQERSYSSKEWQENALRFHEINLTQGFDSAVAWLSDLVDKS